MQLNSHQVSVSPYKGGVALIGTSLEHARTLFAPHAQRSSTPLHVTLLTAAEYKALGRPDLLDIKDGITLDNIYVLGEGTSNRSESPRISWLVVVWNHADVWRKRNHLERKQYHITLSDENDHTLDKGISGLLRRCGTEGYQELLERVEKLGVDAMDHVLVACQATSEEFAIILAERMIITYPGSFKGYIRLGQIQYTVNPKLASLAYAQGVKLNPNLVNSVSNRLRKLSDTMSYGPIVTAQELDIISKDLRGHVLRPWPKELESRLSDMLWTTATVSRTRAIYMGYELPRFFSWLYPGRLAGMSTPRNENDIDTLLAMGFSHVLTLTKEEPLPSSWFGFKPLRHLYIPIENYGTPTFEEMDVIWSRVREGGTWLVHCGGGVGRAGTVLACLIAMLGTESRGEGPEEETTDQPRLDPREAIHLLRRARPRSLESEAQERFVSEWVSHRWKLAHTSTPVPCEPVTVLRVESTPSFRPPTFSNAPSSSLAIMMVGRPGSGKSWASTAIAKRRPRGKTVYISQDETRSRESCERSFGHRCDPDTLIILDRCNPTREDRRQWLKLCQADQVVAFYFDYPRELRQSRVDQRVDHPSVRAGKSKRAMERMDKVSQAPTLSEGFAAIYTITSFSAAREAVYRLTGDPCPPLVKFPRTPHLFDLGAATSDDLVASSSCTDSSPHLCNGMISVEEKIDGANMGFSLSWDGSIRVQNRSHWISSSDQAQFKPLDYWIASHKESLRRILDRDPQYPERWILYGEWMVAQHSIPYDSIPDRFIAFDLYDRLKEAFVSRRLLTQALSNTGIFQVPLLWESGEDGYGRGKIGKEELSKVVQGTSAFGKEKMEGVYLRFEDKSRSKTVSRAKVVRGDFIAGNQHWSKNKVTLNGIAQPAGEG